MEGKGAYYNRELEKYLHYLISANSSVLVIGCGTGDLLAALNPKREDGIDMSPKMVEMALQNILKARRHRPGGMGIFFISGGFFSIAAE